MTDPVSRAEDHVRRYRRRRSLMILLMIFLISLITSPLWAMPSRGAEPPPARSSAVSTEDTVLPGLSLQLASSDDCKAWVAGWVSVPVKCDRKPLPGWVRRCAGAGITSALLAYLSGGAGIWAGAGSGVAGCVAWDRKWGG